MNNTIHNQYICHTEQSDEIFTAIARSKKGSSSNYCLYKCCIIESIIVVLLGLIFGIVTHTVPSLIWVLVLITCALWGIYVGVINKDMKKYEKALGTTFNGKPFDCTVTLEPNEIVATYIQDDICAASKHDYQEIKDVTVSKNFITIIFNDNDYVPISINHLIGYTKYDCYNYIFHMMKNPAT